MADYDGYEGSPPPRLLRQPLADALAEPPPAPPAPAPAPPASPEDAQRPTPQLRAKAYEAMLRANPPLRVETPPPSEPAAETRPKVREILFRGAIYKFKPIGPDTGNDHRPGVVERWQADVRVADGTGFNLVVSEFRDGRFTPWSFDGIFFTDFLQAAIVGVVSGGFKANWHHEQWAHERTRHKYILFVLPAVATVCLLTGIVLGLR